MMMIRMPILDNSDFVSRMLDWSNYLYVFAIVVTVLATFGVVYFGKLASSLKDAELSRYKSEADARISASELATNNALLEISHSKERITLAERQMAEANERAKRYEAEVASARLEALKAIEAAEREHIARLQLEASLAPRRLSANQRQAIRDGMAPLQKIPITFHATGGDLEAARFAAQIAQAMTDAGFQVKVLSDSLNIAPVVAVTSIPRTQPELTGTRKQIVEILRGAGIQNVQDLPTGGGDRDIGIIVGPKDQ